MMKVLLRELAALDDLVRDAPPRSTDLTGSVLGAFQRLSEAREARFMGPSSSAAPGDLVFAVGPLGRVSLAPPAGRPGFATEVVDALQVLVRYVVALVATDEARRLAEVAQEAKKRFLASLSHELRTPLNGILGFSQLLEASLVEGDQVSMVKNIDECGQRLLNTVDNILELAEYESEGFRLENDPFAPRAVLEAVSTKYAALAGDRSLGWSVTVLPGIPSVLRGDPVRLGQAWGHILSNAVKFTLQGGVDVALGALPLGQGRWELTLTVDDTGIGLAPGALAQGILPFRQHDDTLTRRFGGSGLGLSLCDRIARSMAGGLGFESRPGGGTRVRVWVTLDASEGLA